MTREPKGLGESPFRRRDPLIGEVVAGTYRVEAAIARGGMGQVYRAEQLRLGRKVALKILDVREEIEDSASNEGADAFRQRFDLEASAGAALKHPNTVVVHDYGEAEEGVYYIAMELLRGETLSRVLDREVRVSPSLALHVALQVAASIGEAHAQGLIHRDLKPSNIMLSRVGDDPCFVKVLDFGLVKRERDDVGLTRSGALVGTPRYMSPEQIAAEPIGKGTDVYSLGAVLYHAITGRPPFEAESKYVLMAAHVNVSPPAFAEAAPDLDVSPELEGLVMRCLRKAPVDRFGSMDELADAIRALQADDPELRFDARAVPAMLEGPVSGTRAKVSEEDVPTEVSVGMSGALVEEGPRTESIRPGGVSISSELFATTDPDPDPASDGPSVEDTPPRRRWVLLGLLAAGCVALLMLRPWSSAPAPEQPVVGAPVVPSAAAVPAPDPDPEPEPEVLPEIPTETAPAPPTTQVLLETSPTGARLTRSGVDLGDTPARLQIPSGESWVIEVSAPGHLTRTVQIGTTQPSVHVRLRRRPMARRPEGSVSRPMRTAPAMRATDNRNPWGMR